MLLIFILEQNPIWLSMVSKAQSQEAQSPVSTSLFKSCHLSEQVMVSSYKELWWTPKYLLQVFIAFLKFPLSLWESIPLLMNKKILMKDLNASCYLDTFMRKLETQTWNKSSWMPLKWFLKPILSTWSRPWSKMEPKKFTLTLAQTWTSLATELTSIQKKELETQASSCNFCS